MKDIHVKVVIKKTSQNNTKLKKKETNGQDLMF